MLTIKVTDADDAGAVVFLAEAAVGVSLEAHLRDQDTMVRNVSWQWARSALPDSGFTNIAGAATVSYTPVDGDHAYFLRATATYADSFGAGKTAAGAVNRPVGLSQQALMSQHAKAEPSL